VTVLWMALAGGLGAVARFVVDGLVRDRFGSSFPLGTVVINITGSFVLGVVTGVGIGQLVAPEWRLIVGTGFCGGYTTFSAASFETVRLVEQRRSWLALLNAAGTLVVTVAVAALGLWLGLVL
jgi:fluoride exporter